MKILSLIKFIVVFLLIFPIAVHSQEAEKHYNMGLISLNNGKALIETVKPSLFDLINNDQQKWSESLKILSFLKDDQTRDRINKIITELDNATKEFNKAIKLKKDYSDAYIKLAETYLVMGDEAKGISAYKSGLQMGYNTLTIPHIELKPVFHSIAKACFIDKGDLAGKEIIEKLINLLDNRLKKEYNGLNSKYNIARLENNRDIIEEILAKMEYNEINRMINELEIVRYYINTGNKEEAEREYETKKREYIGKSNIYRDENKQYLRDVFAELDEEIEVIGSVFEFTVDKKLIDSENKINATIIPKGDYSAKSSFFRLMLMRDNISLNLLTHVSVDSNINRKIQIIPSDHKLMEKYIVRIRIPKLDIKNDNTLPFKMTLNRGIYEQDPMITPSLKNETRLSLKREDGSEIKINFQKDIFTNSTIMEIDKEYGIKKGLYEAEIETSFDVIKSQKISINLSSAKEQPIDQQAEPKSENFMSYIWLVLSTILLLSITIQ